MRRIGLAIVLAVSGLPTAARPMCDVANVKTGSCCRPPHEAGHVPPLAALVAFFGEHRRCGELDGGAEGDVVWMTCTCGAGISQRRELEDRP
jgi:hypothetical protein